MSLFLQSPLSTGVLAAFCSGRHVDSGSVKFFGLLPGVARRQPTFFASPKKVGKERRPEVRRPAKAPGALRYSKRQAAAELGLVAKFAHEVEFVLALKQSSRTTPVVSGSGGASHGTRNPSQTSATLIGTRSCRDQHRIFRRSRVGGDPVALNCKRKWQT